METTNKCVELMNFSEGWEEWRRTLKKSIESSKAYYQDEAVQNLILKLNDFLNKKVCASSISEEIIDSMWDAATSEERKTLALLFLKIADRL